MSSKDCFGRKISTLTDYFGVLNHVRGHIPHIQHGEEGMTAGHLRSGQIDVRHVGECKVVRDGLFIFLKKI